MVSLLVPLGCFGVNMITEYIHTITKMGMETVKERKQQMFSKGSTNNMGRHNFLVKTNIWGNQKEFLTVSF